LRIASKDKLLAADQLSPVLEEVKLNFTTRGEEYVGARGKLI
jgi:hypothetical protein